MTASQIASLAEMLTMAGLDPSIAPDLVPKTRRVWNPCPACDGEGGWWVTTGFIDNDTGYPDERLVPCDECDATGGVEEDAVLITEDDLDEMVPP